MFKHVIRKEPSEGSSSGSEADDFDSENEEPTIDGADVTDAPAGETSAMAAEEAAFWDETDEELPANLPALEEAVENPVFELEVEASGRKKLVCVFCPDKTLRDGEMKKVHLISKSHKRRAARYAEHLEAHPEVTEETADPRRISAFLDMQLRLRKSGGAGFTINPSATKRKRKRNKVKTPEERAAAAARAIANGAAPKDGEDGIAVVAGLTALNAKQKRKLRQLENKAKGKEDSASADDAAEEPKEAAIKPKAAAKAPQVAKAGQAKAERPSTSRGSDKSKKKKTVV